MDEGQLDYVLDVHRVYLVRSDVEALKAEFAGLGGNA